MQETIGQIKNLIVVLIRPSEGITRVPAVSMEVIRTCLVVTTIIRMVRPDINLHVVIIHHSSQATAVRETGVILHRLRVMVVQAAVVVAVTAAPAVVIILIVELLVVRMLPVQEV